ncbi:MAG: head GIN domain-containing protein [Candidatus Zixiibacteriota bacterium]
MRRIAVMALGVTLCLGMMAVDAQARKHRNWTENWSQGTTYDNQEEGSGKLTTETVDVPEFTRIRSLGSFDIIVRIGEKQSIKVTSDDNLHDNFSLTVRGKTLRLDVETSYSTREQVRVEITVPKLEHIRCDGSGEIEVTNLSGGEFGYTLAGSADFHATGQVERLDVELDGSGEIDTRDLIATEVFVEIAGSGTALVYAKESIDAVVSGSGDIRYYGDPTHKSTEVTGSGSCRKGR